ncbi:6028_t:CDS:2 [Paraglomus occultum]|uniref:Golgi apparatus membrane protein TVP38 n=1 Tax=Paraglomus occultum TaxID=144539 RepID=A0A9N9FCA3_9GLOM|nr:6028_t:CDS:2 [Paraglomus occultum]
MFKLLKTRPTALSVSTQTNSQAVGASSSLPDRLQSPTLPVHHAQTFHRQSNKSNSTHSRSLSQSATTLTLGKLSSSAVVPAPVSSPTSPVSQEPTVPIKQIKHRKAFSLSSSASIITFPDDYQEHKQNPNTLPIPVLSSLSSSVHNQASIHPKPNRKLSSFLTILQPWAPLITWAVISLCTLCFVVIYRMEVILALERLAEYVKELGIGGAMILYALIYITTFPLVIGYSTLITLSGFTFGIFRGFIISYFAALSGGVTVFAISRKWGNASVRKLLRKNKHMRGIVRAIEKKGFKLLFLIRLAPYPYNVFNTLLSATNIPLHTFACATALSLSKLVIHVYIGSTLSSFSAHFSSEGHEGDGSGGDISNSPLSTADILKIAMGIVGIVIGIGVVVYIWFVARRMVKEVEEDEDRYDCEYEYCYDEEGKKGGCNVEDQSNHTDRDALIEKGNQHGGSELHGCENSGLLVEEINPTFINESLQPIFSNPFDSRRSNGGKSKSSTNEHKRTVGFVDNGASGERGSIFNTVEAVDDESVNSDDSNETVERIDNEGDGLVQSVATSVSERHSGPVQRRMSKPAI